MNRFDYLHKKYREEKMKSRKEAILNKSRREVETNGNGTSGYTIQEGKNKNKVAGHISVNHQNNSCCYFFTNYYFYSQYCFL